jgi:hypothetical protein
MVQQFKEQKFAAAEALDISGPQWKGTLHNKGIIIHIIRCPSIPAARALVEATAKPTAR